MGKCNKEQGVPSQDKHLDLYKKGKRSSHTGNKPLVQSLHDPNRMVTQKMRNAQERNRGLTS
jgi:hypothetical protein